MKKGRKLRIAIICIVCVVMAICIACGFTEMFYAMNAPQNYMITTENYFEVQSKNQCAGFALAYTLRDFGFDVKGSEAYEAIPAKNEDGTVPPLHMLDYLKEQGHKSVVCISTLNRLKYEIAKGHPVITMLWLEAGSEEAHCIPIVGYDEEYFYAAESVDYMVNCFADECEYYNRKIPVEEMKQMIRMVGPELTIFFRIVN